MTQAERLIRAAWRLYHGGTVTSAWLRKRFGVSKATAKRDLLVLERAVPVKQAVARHARARKALSMGGIVIREPSAD